MIEYARAAGHEVAGLVELVDSSRIGGEVHGLPVVGLDAGPGTAIIGLGGERLTLWARLAEHGWRAATVVHPAAHVSPSAQLAEGCLVAPAAVIGAAAQLGRQTIVARGGLVGHHAHLGAGVVLNPGANVGGNASVGDGAVLGMGAIVVNGVEVGAKALVAAGAVVVRPVEPATRVQGVPARVFVPA
jgi:sugar O-acyltransferase (sialic acid O-acetyltransferase NeuD family)